MPATAAHPLRSLHEYIQKSGSQFVVKSKKGKPMGSYRSRAAAEKRLRQIEFFKHKKTESSNWKARLFEKRETPSLAKTALEFGLLEPAHDESEYDEIQLAAGIEVEREHTDNPAVAAVIAAHHLDEIPDYYDRLAKMEKEALSAEEQDVGWGPFSSRMPERTTA